jgi:hypothetical protein
MTKREKVLLERIESMIKQSKVRLEAWKDLQRSDNNAEVAFQKGYINGLASLKFDIKYNH